MYLEYVKQAFEILRQHQFYIKFSKCAFGKQELEYLVILLLLREWKLIKVKLTQC